jgi:hypothetical protein
MDWFVLFIICAISIFVLSGIVIGLIIMFKLRVRKNVRGIIFLKAGGQRQIWIKRKSSQQTMVDNNTYSFNEKAVIKTPWKDFIYYLEGFSEPIIPDFTKKNMSLTPEELTIILKNDLAQKLFGSAAMATLKLLIIINLLVGIIILLAIFYILFSGVRVKITPELSAMFYNTTRMAIMGI